MNKKVKNVSKSSIILAWILLIMLISAATGLTYLKFFGEIEIENNKESGNEEKISPVITQALTTIVDEFNKEENIQEYKKNNVIVNAELENTSIKVTFKNQETKIYTFKIEIPNLIVDTTSNDQEFEKIFTLMVYACQKRLNNNTDIDEHIKSFLEDGREIVGLSKKNIEANKIEYIIDISKKIEYLEDINDNNREETEEDKNTEEDNLTEENEIKEGE